MAIIIILGSRLLSFWCASSAFAGEFSPQRKWCGRGVQLPLMCCLSTILSFSTAENNMNRPVSYSLECVSYSIGRQRKIFLLYLFCGERCGLAAVFYAVQAVSK